MADIVEKRMVSDDWVKLLKELEELNKTGRVVKINAMTITKNSAEVIVILKKEA